MVSEDRGLRVAWEGRPDSGPVSSPQGGALGMAAWISPSKQVGLCLPYSYQCQTFKRKYLDMHACMLNHFSHV